MSALADVMRFTCRFMDTKEPVDFQAWSLAYEALCQEELDQVGGGGTRPFVVSDI